MFVDDPTRCNEAYATWLAHGGDDVKEEKVGIGKSMIWAHMSPESVVEHRFWHLILSSSPTRGCRVPNDNHLVDFHDALGVLLIAPDLRSTIGIDRLNVGGTKIFSSLDGVATRTAPATSLTSRRWRGASTGKS